MKNFKVEIWKLLKNSQLGMPEIHTIKNFKISSTGVSADWTQMRKETSQTEKQRGKKSNTVSKRCGTITKGLIYI